MNSYFKKEEVEYTDSILYLRRLKIDLYDQDAYKQEVIRKRKFRSTSIYDIKVKN